MLPTVTKLVFLFTAMKSSSLILLAILAGTLFTSAQTLRFPAMEPELLKPKYELDYWGKLELSGIVKSRSNSNVFWIHNDSGDQPRVFAIDSLGQFYTSDRYKNREGIVIAGATNVDWEDITMDKKGNLVIADIGNNGNDRKDLLLYMVPEPSPVASNTTFLKKLFIRYPDQKAFPDAADYNYDAEAVFYADNHVYVLSKNRSDTFTKLYRLDQEKTDDINTLTFVDKFNIGGKVTAADASDDGNRIVVITYEAIWIFERTTAGSDYFNGHIWWLPVKAPQIESVCFRDSKRLWLLDEITAAVYEVPVNKLIKLK